MMNEDKKKELIKEMWEEPQIPDKRFRDQQIFRASAARETQYHGDETDLSEFAKSRRFAYRSGFFDGAEWSDKHPNKQTVQRIVEKCYEWFFDDPSRVMTPRLNDCVKYILTSKGI